MRGIQHRISWEGRDAVARAMAQTTAERVDGFRGGRDPELIALLRRDGHCRAPLHVESAACAAVEEYFRRAPCYAAHVPAKSDGVTRSLEQAAACSNYASYTLEQNLGAPRIIELALDPAVLDLVGTYLGCAPSLYSINTFWTFPNPGPGMTHHYHRDEDDYRFAVVFIYWTAVEAGEGEFYFIEGTHDREVVESRLRPRSWRPFRRKPPVAGADELRWLSGGTGYGNDALYEELFGRYIRRIEGQAGLATVSDTFGLHRGALPGSRMRLCTWIRYGLYANLAYMHDRTAPVPASRVRNRVADDSLTRHVTRLVLDWQR